MKKKTRPALARTVDRFATHIVRQRWLWMVLGCLSFLPLVFWQSGLTMDRSLASMFAPDDPVLRDYQTLQATFGGNLVVMLVYDDEQLMSAQGLARSRLWSERIEQLDGVEGVLSVAKLVDAFTFLRPGMPSSLTSSDGERSGAEEQIALFAPSDPVARQFRDLFSGYTHSPDEETAAIVVMLHADAPGDGEGLSQTVTRLRQLTAEFPPQAHAMIVGEPVLLEDAFNLILADGRRLAMGTIGLLCLVILLTLRDWRVVLLSALSITWSHVATRAAMVGLGVELSLVSAILLALVSVIAVASIMHVAVRCGQRRERVTSVLAVLGIPIACTCFTDAAGFASLAVSSVRPVIEFGIMTAMAACFVLLSLILFTPCVMSFPERLFRFTRSENRRNDSTSPAKSWLKRVTGFADPFLSHFSLKLVLQRWVGWSVRFRVLLSIASIAVLLASLGYVMTLQTNGSFLDNFRSDSSIVRAYSRVEKRLGGAGVWDVVLPAPETISPEYLQRVRELENALRQIEVDNTRVSGGGGPLDASERVRLSKVLSLADADAVASQVTLLSLVTPEVRLAGMRAAIPTFAEALLTFPAAGKDDTVPPSRYLRIMIRSQEALPGGVKTALMERVKQAVQAAGFDTTSQAGDAKSQPGAAMVTGYSVLMSRLVASLIRDQWSALAVALLAVGLLILTVTRSPRLTIAALIVNTLPILVVLSLLGVMGGQLDLGSAMIGAVSIGLSIDGSIHFLSGYQRRRMGPGSISSADAAMGSASDLGAPILLASAALVIGFAVLITSPFVPTSTFGLLVSATLALSAIVNLTLLPAMVASPL